MKGYQFTITNDEKVVQVYTTDKKVFEDAINLVIETYVGKDLYNSYLNNTQKEIKTTGTKVENIYISNIERQNKKYIIPKLQMLDYYLKISYEKKIINKRKYEVISNYLLEITKMIYGWICEKSR